MAKKKSVKKKVKMKKPEKQKCKACGSGQVYVRIKEGSVVCRLCGNIDPMEK